MSGLTSGTPQFPEAPLLVSNITQSKEFAPAVPAKVKEKVKHRPLETVGLQMN